MATTKSPQQRDNDKNPGQDEFDKLIDRGFSRGQREADNNQPSTDAAKRSKSSEGAESQLLSQLNSEKSLYKSSNPVRGLRGRFLNLSGRQKTIYGLGIGGGIVGIIIGAFLAMLPLELIHIKNVFYKEIGGVQSRTYQLGRERYYSRMFFFDKEGDFSGYKDTTIRGMMYKNRQTKRLTQALEANGYKIEFEKVNGQETGKVKALHRIDRRGKIIPGQSITSEKQLQSAWDIKKSRVLPEILGTVYPEESARWHGKQAKKLYKRWGLTRTNWIAEYLKEKSGQNALERKELAIRAALRQKLFGSSSPGQPFATAVNEEDLESQDEAIRDRANRAISDNELAKAVGGGAQDLQKNLLENPEFIPEEPSMSSLAEGAVKGLSPEEIAKGAAKSVPSSMVRSLNALGAVQYACVGKGALDSIVTGARVLRSAQLMRFGMSVLNIADAAQDGKDVKSQDVDLMMTYLNSKDKNGKTMFNSSGWHYWTNPKADKNNFSFSKFDIEERNKYAVGGGFTGTLASVDHTLNETIGAGRTCKTVNNPFVQLGGFIVGIGAGIFTGGIFTATNLAVNLGVGAVVNVAVSVATEMLTPIIAGTVIHGGETGTAVGNALVSGMEVLTNANGANAGMKPLTAGEYKTALADTEAYQNSRLAEMDVLERLFSPENDKSITIAAFLGMKNFSPTSVTRSPLATLSNIMSGLLGDRTSAASGANSCPDPDIAKNKLATTPFCTVIVGIPKSIIDDPNYYPDVVEQQMVQGGYVDQSGLPVEGAGYDAYLKQCTSDNESSEGTDYRSIDIIHNSDTSYTDVCSKTPLFYMYRFYSYIGQTENDGLTGNNISDSFSSGEAEETTDSQPIAGDAKEIAAKILEAEKVKRILFNVLNQADVFAESTPKDNIVQTAQGQPAKTTRDCTGRKGVAGPNPSTPLNTNLLKFIYDLSQSQTIQINSLAGQCHGSSTSNHYNGTAVDFGCPFNEAVADQIAAKYGVKKYPAESCTNGAAHFHYSVSGR